MGAVTLLVGDLDAMTRYYRDVVTLEVLAAEGDTVTLGRAGRPIVVLRHEPALRHAVPGSAGLFHTAIVFETQEALAAALYSVATRAPGTFTGSADHLVSQAFYFTDPEGNGIELYWDRARTDWSWTHGQIEMATLFLDPNRFLQEHLTEQALAGSTARDAASVGHVHLSVGDVATARAFYVDALGFDETASLGRSGGVRQRRRLPPPHGDERLELARCRTRGCRRWASDASTSPCPTRDALGALEERLRHHGFAVRDDGRTLAFEDPWNNAILATAAER